MQSSLLMLLERTILVLVLRRLPSPTSLPAAMVSWSPARTATTTAPAAAPTCAGWFPTPDARGGRRGGEGGGRGPATGGDNAARTTASFCRPRRCARYGNRRLKGEGRFHPWDRQSLGPSKRLSSGRGEGLSVTEPFMYSLSRYYGHTKRNHIIIDARS